MQRHVIGFRQDDEGQWVAVLDCHHGRHVRHRPPWEERPWTQTVAGRAAMVAEPLDCPKCEWIELPADLVLDRRTPEWTEATVPAGLLGDHRVAAGVWGRLRVFRGSVDFHFADGLPGAATGPLRGGETQLIPPGRPHRLDLVGPVRLAVEFLVPER